MALIKTGQALLLVWLSVLHFATNHHSCHASYFSREINKYLGLKYKAYATLHGSPVIHIDPRFIQNDFIDPLNEAVSFNQLKMSFHIDKSTAISDSLKMAGVLFIPEKALKERSYKSFQNLRNFFKGKRGIRAIPSSFILPFGPDSSIKVDGPKNSKSFKKFSAEASLMIPSRNASTFESLQLYIGELSATKELQRGQGCGKGGIADVGTDYLKRAARKAKMLFGDSKRARCSHKCRRPKPPLLFKSGSIDLNESYLASVALVDSCSSKIIWTRFVTVNGVTEDLMFKPTQKCLRRIKFADLGTQKFGSTFCPICLDDFEPELDDVNVDGLLSITDVESRNATFSRIVETPCRHLFHQECLKLCYEARVRDQQSDRFRLVNKLAPFSCPLCKDFLCYL